MIHIFFLVLLGVGIGIAIESRPLHNLLAVIARRVCAVAISMISMPYEISSSAFGFLAMTNRALCKGLESLFIRLFSIPFPIPIATPSVYDEGSGKAGLFQGD